MPVFHRLPMTGTHAWQQGPEHTSFSFCLLLFAVSGHEDQFSESH